MSAHDQGTKCDCKKCALCRKRAARREYYDANKPNITPNQAERTDAELDAFALQSLERDYR